MEVKPSIKKIKLNKTSRFLRLATTSACTGKTAKINIVANKIKGGVSLNIKSKNLNTTIKLKM